MRRIILGLSVMSLVINTSCKKCTKCHYTYSTSEIVQTPNGEETVVTEGRVGYVVNDDGEQFTQECVKSGESPTIEVIYMTESENTTLSDFEVVCEDI
jgi:hypothetical protein